jgi:hypothetical protein
MNTFTNNIIKLFQNSFENINKNETFDAYHFIESDVTFEDIFDEPFDKPFDNELTRKLDLIVNTTIDNESVENITTNTNSNLDFFVYDVEGVYESRNEKEIYLELKKKYKKDSIINTIAVSGSVITGAVTGAIFGPLGATIGAGIGIGSGILVIFLKDL